MSDTSHAPLKIAVIAFSGISSFHLSVPCVVFGQSMNTDPNSPGFALRVCTWERGYLATSSGFDIRVHHTLRALDDADVVIMPSWRNAEEPVPRVLCTALRKAYARGATVVGLCLGAYALAEAGLLNGRRATTHWAFAAHFAQRYPAVSLLTESLYIDDERLLTSAGTAAGLDCCLHFVRQRYGAEQANALARLLVTPPHREGGQAQYIEQPIPATSADSRLSGLLDWVREHLSEPHDLDTLAEKAMMSRRSFTRHFRQLTGCSVGQWLQAERLAMARRLLESTAHSVEQIAVLAGLGAPESFRYHFRQAFGVSPRAWRKTFRGAESE